MYICALYVSDYVYIYVCLKAPSHTLLPSPIPHNSQPPSPSHTNCTPYHPYHTFKLHPHLHCPIQTTFSHIPPIPISIFALSSCSSPYHSQHPNPLPKAHALPPLPTTLPPPLPFLPTPTKLPLLGLKNPYPTSTPNP